jgi:hypothetical protein
MKSASTKSSGEGNRYLTLDPSKVSQELRKVLHQLDHDPNNVALNRRMFLMINALLHDDQTRPGKS